MLVSNASFSLEFSLCGAGGDADRYSAKLRPVIALLFSTLPEVESPWSCLLSSGKFMCKTHNAFFIIDEHDKFHPMHHVPANHHVSGGGSRASSTSRTNVFARLDAGPC